MTSIRSITPKERSILKGQQVNCSSNIREEATLLFSPFVSFIIVFAILWAIFAWLGRLIFDFQFGWSSQWAPWIWIFGFILGLVLFGRELSRQLKDRSARSNLIQVDLKAGEVEELELKIIETKRLQEPEHGGLFYFFRTSDSQVFVMFDYESQDLGVDGRDPLESQFKPAEILNITRAISSRIILNQTFSGPQLQLGAPIEMTAPPNLWPETEEFCEINWQDIEERYAA